MLCHNHEEPSQLNSLFKWSCLNLCTIKHFMCPRDSVASTLSYFLGITHNLVNKMSCSVNMQFIGFRVRTPLVIVNATVYFSVVGTAYRSNTRSIYWSGQRPLIDFSTLVVKWTWVRTSTISHQWRVTVVLFGWYVPCSVDSFSFFPSIDLSSRQ